MNDVKKAAAERAAHPSSTPAGSSFESDRKREKAALTMQLDSLDSSQIRKIAAVSETDGTHRKLRVASYCRVSTDDIDQAISIHLQQAEYKKKIKSNPDWIFAGMYVDNGFSGTNTAHRPGFLKLIEDCRAGKIDMVITKAVSRFARNLMDCIKYVEELKNLSPPVNVYFEQEKLDTGLQTSGVILIVLAMVAEEESHMKSEAMLLSLEWRFSRGRFLTPALFGYDNMFNEAESRFQILEKEISELNTRIASIKAQREKIAIYLNTLKADNKIIEEFNEDLWCAFVDKVTVYTDNNLKFQFKDGSDMSISIDERAEK